MALFIHPNLALVHPDIFAWHFPPLCWIGMENLLRSVRNRICVSRPRPPSYLILVSAVANQCLFFCFFFNVSLFHLLRIAVCFAWEVFPRKWLLFVSASSVACSDVYHIFMISVSLFWMSYVVSDRWFKTIVNIYSGVVPVKIWGGLFPFFYCYPHFPHLSLPLSLFFHLLSLAPLESGAFSSYWERIWWI